MKISEALAIANDIRNGCRNVGKADAILVLADAIKDRETSANIVADVLRQHRCNDWYTEDDGGHMQLLDVLAQHSEDGTVRRAIDEIDDLAADIVDALRSNNIAESVRKLCEHKSVFHDLDGAATCVACNEDLGWYCEKSPSYRCEYSANDECCVHCGQPEERQ